MKMLIKLIIDCTTLIYYGLPDIYECTLIFSNWLYYINLLWSSWYLWMYNDLL